MPLPIRHKTARQGVINRYLSYSYVGKDDFSDHVTVGDVLHLFTQEGMINRGFPGVTVVICGEFAYHYPGHPADEVVTCLNYPETGGARFFETVAAHVEENPNRSAHLWINDFVKNMTLKYQAHEWFAVYRVSIIDE